VYLSTNFTGSVAKGHGYFVWPKGPKGSGRFESSKGASPTVANCTPTRKSKSQASGVRSRGEQKGDFLST